MSTDTHEHAKEMERAFLGGLLNANSREIKTRLTADDFFTADHQKVFKTILKLAGEGKTPDIQIVTAELKGKVTASVIADLTSANYSTANNDYYENEIYQESFKRNALKAVEKIKTTLSDQSLTQTEKETALKQFNDAINGIYSARIENGIKTGAELLQTPFPEIKWIIKNMIGEGLTMLCGAPKIGKSWLVLNLAIAAAAGGKFLGKKDTEKTDTLYLALEDTDRRLHNRLKELKAPANEMDTLHIITKWNEGFIGLESYLKNNKNIGLVIIDTLVRFANIDDMNEYSQTTKAMARIKSIADAANIAILVIHHTKKTGTASVDKMDWTELALGSTGLTGAADSILFLDRDRSGNETKNTGKLFITGRDTKDDKYEMKFDMDTDGALRGWTITEKPPTEKKTNSNSTNSEGVRYGS